MKTKQQQVAEYLLGQGYIEEKGKTSKYRVFRPKGGPENQDRKYFVGKAGAVRVGRIASDTLSVTDAFYRRMERDLAASRGVG